MPVYGTADLIFELIGGATMEASMKRTIPGIMVAALVLASPVAFAQYEGHFGTASTPAASVAKDDQTKVTKRSKKHMASYKHRHHAKHMGSKSQTTGAGNSSAPKDDTTPKSR